MTYGKVLEIADFIEGCPQDGSVAIGALCVKHFPESLSGRKSGFWPGEILDKVKKYKIREMPEWMLKKHEPYKAWSRHCGLKPKGRADDFTMPLELQQDLDRLACHRVVGSTVGSACEPGALKNFVDTA